MIQSIKNHTITLRNQEIAYALKRSRRARYMRVAVYCDANVVVISPRFSPHSEIENFLCEKAKWIIEKINYFKKSGIATRLSGSKVKYKRYRDYAFCAIKGLADEYNRVYGFKYAGINIRNQKARWGSCSRARILNFNYRIIFLPNPLQEYIICHELCHLKEFNHSARFWKLVSLTISDYKRRVGELRRYSLR